MAVAVVRRRVVLRAGEEVVAHAEPAAELLAVPGLVVLEPVEDVLALDAAVAGEVRRDLLDLRRVGRPHAAAVHLLQDHQLLRSRAPTGRRRLRHYYIILLATSYLSYMDRS